MVPCCAAVHYVPMLGCEALQSLNVKLSILRKYALQLESFPLQAAEIEILDMYR